MNFYHSQHLFAVLNELVKRAASLSFIVICRVLTLQLLATPKSQSKRDRKTITNVCKIFFLKPKTPLCQTIIIGRLLAIKKFPALHVLCSNSGRNDLALEG